jgi:hypothetical protein
MKIGMAFGIGLLATLAGLPAQAAGKAPGSKGPPGCAAIEFRPVPSGLSDGEQTAGLYRSRFGKIELHAEVKQGEPADYFVVAGGKRMAAAPATLPEPALACAAAKKLPAPGAAASPCTGQRFKLVVAHAGKDRLGLLYALDGSSWRFCTAGAF